MLRPQRGPDSELRQEACPHQWPVVFDSAQLRLREGARIRTPKPCSARCVILGDFELAFEQKRFTGVVKSGSLS